MRSWAQQEKGPSRAASSKMAQRREQEEDTAAGPAPEELRRPKSCPLNIGILIAVLMAFVLGAFATQLWQRNPDEDGEGQQLTVRQSGELVPTGFEDLPETSILTQLVVWIAAGVAMARAAAKRAKAEEDVEGEGFEDAGDAEQWEDEEEDDEEEEEKSADKKQRRAPSRRKTLLIPSKGPAILKASREEAAKIRANQNAKAAKLSSKRGHVEDDEDGSGSRTMEKSRRRAAQYAKALKAEKAGRKK
ncbi:unnamed protein product [Scytosiphon promiscuus]